MVRLGFIGLSVVMAFVPLTFYWAMNRPSSTPTAGTRPAYYYRYYSYYGGPRLDLDSGRRYRGGGGRGGWLSSSYSSGRGGYDRAGGASAFRGGGPSAGGK